MLGVVRALGTLPCVPPMLGTYRGQRRAYPVAEVIEVFARTVAGVGGREAAEVLARFWLFKGHLSGYTFLREYLESLVARHGSGERTQQRARERLQVRYWQCSLLGKNQLRSATPAQTKEEHAAWLAQLGLTTGVLGEVDAARGGFLNADLLVMFRDGDAGMHDLLALDVSAFATGGETIGEDLLSGGALLHMLEDEAFYQAERGGFARLSIEANAATGSLFTGHLASYFAAFARDDKESYKLIQAASYAHSFLAFAQRTGVLSSADGIRPLVVGYTSRGVNSMALRSEHWGVLAACHKIYRDAKDYHVPAGPSETGEIDQARRQLLRLIARTAKQLFADGERLIDDLPAAIAEGRRLDHAERLPPFQNTAGPVAPEILARYDLGADELRPHSRGPLPDTRAAHTALVWRALAAGRRYLFLTGNPGIGKTTAIATYLQTMCHKDGYLLLYASPRKVVNQDIFGKFAGDAPGTYRPAHFVGLTTNSTLIREAGGAAVHYLGVPERLPDAAHGVRYLRGSLDDEHRTGWRTGMGPRVVPSAEDTLRDQGMRGAGVLQTLCAAIAGVLSTAEPNAVVAAAAIQSLKRGKGGRDTLDHLRGIFGSAYQRSEGTFLRARMEALARTTRHIVIMVDEITGDGAGYEFFRRMAEILDDWSLEQYGFRITLVVADASITAVEVVQAHLALGQREPDTRKIYLSVLPEGKGEPTPDAVSISSFRFAPGGLGDPDDAYLVNTNSFPAAALTLRYRTRVALRELPEGCSRAEARKLLSTWKLDEAINEDIVGDVSSLLASSPSEQLIVYVQNKRRLQAIIDTIAAREKACGQSFEPREHYLTIHADNAPEDLALVHDEEARGRFSVFFITSSASRGLTFPRVRHILVDVPRFQVESNLMEIVQVIYRGRGGPYDLTEKTLTFYLSDRVVARAGNRQQRVREATLDMMTLLALLKLCVVTRIRGAMPLGDRALSLIPIGGKNVSGAGRAYHHDLADLDQALGREMQGARAHDPNLRTLKAAVGTLMAQARFAVPRIDGSYLSLLQEVGTRPQRLDAWIMGDAPIQEAYVHGSLLVVPMGAGEVETTHRMSLAGAIRQAVDENTQRAVRNVLGRRGAYPEAIYRGVKDLDELLSELQSVGRTQDLEHRGVLADGYCVFPLATFVASAEIAAYCTRLRDEDDTEQQAELRNALHGAMRETYPLDTVLPIGAAYQEFPFLTVTSQDLLAMRAKLFRSGTILMSREMNVLTMLLAR